MLPTRQRLFENSVKRLNLTYNSSCRAAGTIGIKKECARETGMHEPPSLLGPAETVRHELLMASNTHHAPSTLHIMHFPHNASCTVHTTHHAPSTLHIMHLPHYISCAFHTTHHAPSGHTTHALSTLHIMHLPHNTVQSCTFHTVADIWRNRSASRFRPQQAAAWTEKLQP